MTFEALPENGGRVDEDGEIGYIIEAPDPSPSDVLATYRTYRELGGDPFEPYESQLEEQINAELAEGHTPRGRGREILAHLRNTAL